MMCKVGRGAALSDTTLVPTRASEASGNPHPRYPAWSRDSFADGFVNKVP